MITNTSKYSIEQLDQYVKNKQLGISDTKIEQALMQDEALQLMVEGIEMLYEAKESEADFNLNVFLDKQYEATQKMVQQRLNRLEEQKQLSFTKRLKLWVGNNRNDNIKIIGRIKKYSVHYAFICLLLFCFVLHGFVIIGDDNENTKIANIKQEWIAKTISGITQEDIQIYETNTGFYVELLVDNGEVIIQKVKLQLPFYQVKLEKMNEKDLQFFQYTTEERFAKILNSNWKYLINSVNLLPKYSNAKNPDVKNVIKKEYLSYTVNCNKSELSGCDKGELSKEIHELLHKSIQATKKKPIPFNAFISQKP